MILDQFKLNGKVALITGISSGLGEAISVGLAEAGADIIGVDYVEVPEIKAKIEAMGRRFLGVVANLTSIEPIQGIINQGVRSFGQIDILINNAGIIRRADSLEFTEKDWDDVMNVNVKTVFFFSQAVAKQFIKQRTSGKIINMASMHSFQGGVHVPSFTASKSGVVGITRLMANEWAKLNINVNAVAPGYMASNDTVSLRSDEERSAEILGRIPAGRWGIPEDLQGAMVFLASPASNYINGYTIAIDGGWLAR
jgi:2-dehydro-3-deoxy-D-gluconate 5-dehydrogenase